REPMLIREPVHRAATDAAVRHGDAWDRYAELMGEEQPAEAAAFYRSRWCGVHRPECVDRLDRDRDCPRCPAHDRCMDAGAVVSWRWRKNPEETSAVEHAMKIAIRNPVFFAAHMQQAPLSLESESVQVTAAMVARRVSGLPAGRVPMDCSHVSAYIDMHDEILYWAVCAWNPATFGGQVIDYGTFPEQPGRWFVQARPPRPMSSLFGRLGKAGAIAAGLEQLATRLMKTEFGRHAAGGQVTRFQVERLLVDARYPRHEPIIARVKRKMGSPVLMLAKGIGLTAEHKPFAAYSRKPGETLGHHWRIPNVRGTREFPFVAVDTNYWKSFVHRSLAIGAGEPGALTLFGAPSQFSEHEPFAEHLAASEYPTETMSRRWGNVVNVWKTRVGKPDNHWFDCVVGCAVGAAMLGCRSSEDARRAGAVGGSGGRRKALRPLGQIGR
ncbi:MAG TPA: terminase gpA endonuclease subunit, partial [Phycisphaerae bacterium]|nr:terminase gpA endonuclease subunit [Phycisphaerae bacterium]